MNHICVEANHVNNEQCLIVSVPNQTISVLNQLFLTASMILNRITSELTLMGVELSGQVNISAESDHISAESLHVSSASVSRCKIVCVCVCAER